MFEVCHLHCEYMELHAPSPALLARCAPGWVQMPKQLGKTTTNISVDNRSTVHACKLNFLSNSTALFTSWNCRRRATRGSSLSSSSTQSSIVVGGDTGFVDLAAVVSGAVAILSVFSCTHPLHNLGVVPAPDQITASERSLLLDALSLHWTEVLACAPVLGSQEVDVELQS